MATGAEIIKRYESLQQVRRPLDSSIKSCYSYTFPLRGVRFGGDPFATAESSASEAKSLQSQMTDSTAPDACCTLTSALVSGVTPANQKWFGWKLDNEAGKEVNDWLDKAATTIHGHIHSSNFDAPNYEVMLDYVISGMGALFIDEGTESLYSFELWSLASCFFDSSRRSGPIDIVYRPYTLTALQAVNEFGASKLPEKIVTAAQKTPSERFKFVHAIQPRTGEAKRVKDKLLRWESQHVAIESKRVVRDSGYHEFPLAVPRGLKLPDSCYAEGFMSRALPDTKTLNESKRLTLANADIAIAGMWGAVDDGVINPKTVKIGARRIIMMREKNSFFPLASGGKFDVSNLISQDLKASIRRVLMADILETATPGPAKTATEWHYRVNLIRQLLGPMYGRLQSEYLQQLVFRCFMIALRKGVLGNPPDALNGRSMNLRYISPLARAQQAEELNAMEAFEMNMLNNAKVAPMLAETMDNYDWDKAARKKAELQGVPVDLIKDDKQVKKDREDRAKAMQAQQQQMQQAQQQQAMMQQAQKAAPAEGAM